MRFIFRKFRYTLYYPKACANGRGMKKVELQKEGERMVRRADDGERSLLQQRPKGSVLGESKSVTCARYIAPGVQGRLGSRGSSPG